MPLFRLSFSAYTAFPLFWNAVISKLFVFMSFINHFDWGKSSCYTLYMYRNTGKTWKQPKNNVPQQKKKKVLNLHNNNTLLLERLIFLDALKIFFKKKLIYFLPDLRTFAKNFWILHIVCPMPFQTRAFCQFSGF